MIWEVSDIIGGTCIHVYMYTCIHVYMYTCTLYIAPVNNINELMSQTDDLARVLDYTLDLSTHLLTTLLYPPPHMYTSYPFINLSNYHPHL